MARQRLWLKNRKANHVAIAPINKNRTYALVKLFLSLLATADAISNDFFGFISLSPKRANLQRMPVED